MKFLQQLLVGLLCFFVINTAFARGEAYDVVIAVSVEPDTSGHEDYVINVDQHVTRVNQNADEPTLSAASVPGKPAEMSETYTKNDSVVREIKP